MQTSRHRLNRRLFRLVFLLGSFLGLAYLAVFLQTGPFGAFLLLRNDLLPDLQRSIFTLSFPTAFLVSAIFLDRHMVLPKFDILNRVIVTNSLVFCILGLSFAALRVPLLSREVFFLEFFSSTLLISVYIYSLHRLFPRILGITPDVDSEPFRTFPAIVAIEIDSEINDAWILDVDAVATNLRAEPSPDTSQLLFTLTQKRIPVYDATSLIEDFWGKIELSKLKASVLESFSPPAGYIYIKRLIELCLIVASLPVILPLAIVTAVAIKIDSPGPILFVQTRIGLGGKKFSMMKFRSMYAAEAHYGEKNSFAKENDSRITPVGRLLRRFRLDELPQFWNIVRGEMSLIGPRPEQVAFAEHFTQVIPFYSFRHSVPPGITGWGQVMHGYADSEVATRTKLELDFFYIKHMSLWLDLLITIKTARTILLGSGAR